MGLLTMLADLRAMRIVDEVALQLARQAQDAVRIRCALRVPTMTQAEARGYVWATAQPILVAQAARISVAQAPIAPVNLALATERARDRVVNGVLSELARERLSIGQRRRAA